MLIGSRDYLVITYRPSRLGNRDNAGFAELIDPITEREETIRRDYCTGRTFSSLGKGAPGGPDPGLIPGPDADCGTVLDYDDRIRFGVRNDRPSKHKVGQLICSYRLLANGLPILGHLRREGHADNITSLGNQTVLDPAKI